MELKTYMLIVLRRWWIIVLTFLSTVIPAYIFTINQPLIYESTTTFIMRPRQSLIVDEDKLVDMVDTLSRRVEINTTYAAVAESKLIKNLAAKKLEIPSGKLRNLSVSSKVVAGTNILEVRVEGSDPVLTRDFANAVTAETKVFVSNLYDVFELEPLDEAEIPRNPISPRKTLNMAVGAILALGLGIVLVFLFEYVFALSEEPVAFDIIDHDTGVYNQAYLKLRLRQEMSRARRNDSHFSLALMRIDHAGINETSRLIPAAALRSVAALLVSSLRDEDVLSRFDQTTFVLLLPEITGEAAAALVERLRIKVETTQLDLILQTVAGIAAFENHDTSLDEFLAQATFALRKADSTTYRAVHLFSQANTNPAEHYEPGNGDTASKVTAPTK